MSRDLVRTIALGIGGLVVALVLTVGAFAIAGQDISEPAGVPMFTAPPSSPSPSHENDDRQSPGPKQSPTASSSDDHGGVTPGSDDGTSVDSGGRGSDDSGSGTDDSSGSGSGSNSGSGSSNSGSGSSNSGSGSSSSGSGSSNSGSGSSSSGSGSDGHGDD